MERISSFYSLEHLVSTLDEQGVPEEYICPITQDFMRDPCIAADGTPLPPISPVLAFVHRASTLFTLFYNQQHAVFHAHHTITPTPPPPSQPFNKNYDTIRARCSRASASVPVRCGVCVCVCVCCAWPSAGHTYERAAIEEWLGRHGTSPITRDYISAEHLMPDATLRKMIDDFLGEKRQLLLSQREREKELSPSSDPETDKRRQLQLQSPTAPNHIASRGDDDDDDGDENDDVEHPYVHGGPKAERAPLIGLSAKGQQRQRMGDAQHPRLGKGESSSRSLHADVPHSGDSRRVSSSCWMCVLY
jgi:hypothetical protein